MKATWTSEEHQEMLQKPLPFTADDVVLIRLGLAARRSRMSLDGNASIRAKNCETSPTLRVCLSRRCLS
jgi:hypothetical protein